MKRYLGAYMNVFIAIACTLFFLCPLGVGIYLLIADRDKAGAILFFSAAAMFFLFIVLLSNQIFAWGHFYQDKLKVSALFRKNFTVEYSKCVDVGIAHYFHGAHSSSIIGSRVFYIYLSYTYLEPKYKNNINMAQPTKTFVKIGYSRKTYEYLMKVLPERQAVMLSDSHKKLFK